MKKAYVFPGQAAQFEGMGKDLFEQFPLARKIFEEANEILGFSISEVMFHGSSEELKQTKITQPSVFLHSVIKARLSAENFRPDVVAGHSLGEFSALVASEAMTFEDGLRLVQQRALAMQKACEATESTMAAVLGLSDESIEKICAEIPDIVVPANYNCPGQLVISGSLKGIELAAEALKAAGAKRVIVLQVGGAFHSPLMEPAREELARAIEHTKIVAPKCPIYQNVDAMPVTNSEIIKKNLIAQLTAPVRWTQIMQNMIADGVGQFIEVGGTGKVLLGFVRQLNKEIITETL